MPKSSPPIRFDETKLGQFEIPPEVLRMSNIVNQLRAQGANAAADKIEADAKVVAVCNVHGAIVDPIIGTMGDRVAYGCPGCSSPEVQRAYEAEKP